MWLPGAIWDPGAHASYQAGVSSCLMEVWHYTVGRNSIALIRNNGLAAFLVRDEGIYQFAPSDAVCFTQCEWNRVATATEVESLDGWISEAQLDHLRYLTLWKLTTHGIPQWFYDGPRMPVLNGYRGVTNHRNLVHRACDQHSDGFDRSVWDQVAAPPVPPSEGSEVPSHLIHEVRPNRLDTGFVWVYDGDAHTKTHLSTGTSYAAEVEYRKILAVTGWKVDQMLHRTDADGGVWAGLVDDARNVDEFNDTAAAAPPTETGGATVDEIRAIVQTDGNRTRAEVAKPRSLAGTVG